MDIQEATAGFRSVNREDYPELEEYSREEIYEGHVGPGGLYLAASRASPGADESAAISLASIRSDNGWLP